MGSDKEVFQIVIGKPNGICDPTALKVLWDFTL